MKKWQLIILIKVLMPSALAQVCGDIVNPNADCTLMSPVLDCTPNYIVYSTNGSVLEDGVMSALNSSSDIYYFNWSLNESGIVSVCNYTREVQVGGGDMSDLIAIVLSAIAFLWLLIAISKLLKDEHNILKFIFTSSAVVLGVGCLGYAVQIAKDNGSELVYNATVTLFQTATTIQYLFFGYILFYYVYKLFMYIYESFLKK